MLAVAWQALRNRALLYAGAFVALWLGVSLVAATGLILSARSGVPTVSRFGAATVVVTADPVLHLPAPSARPGTPGRHYQTTLPVAPMLAVSQVRHLARLPGVSLAVADRTFPVQVLGRDGRVVQVPDTQSDGHGWASASFGPYRLAAGSPPATADQVVLDGRLAAAGGYSVGAAVRLLTPGGPVDVHVSGITAPVRTTDASVFFTGIRAGQLSGYPGQASAAVLTPRAEPPRPRWPPWSAARSPDCGSSPARRGHVPSLTLSVRRSPRRAGCSP